MARSSSSSFAETALPVSTGVVDDDFDGSSGDLFSTVDLEDDQVAGRRRRSSRLRNRSSGSSSMGYRWMHLRRQTQENGWQIAFAFVWLVVVVWILEWSLHSGSGSHVNLASNTFVCIPTRGELLMAVDLYLEAHHGNKNNSLSQFQSRIGKLYGPNIEDWCLVTSATIERDQQRRGVADDELNYAPFGNHAGITDLSSVFSTTRNPLAAHFDAADLSRWNIEGVTSLERIFAGASSFNGSVAGWNTSSVITMAGLFQGAQKFNHPSLNTWDTSRVVDLSHAFAATKHFDQPLSNWNTARVTSLHGTFRSAAAFNQALDGWNVSMVQNFAFAFASTKAFNRPLNNWNVTSGKVLEGMFSHASEFNLPLNQWKLSNATDLRRLFANAPKFHQDLCEWGNHVRKPPRGHVRGASLHLMVELMFSQSGCSTYADPNLKATPAGPFCVACLLV